MKNIFILLFLWPLVGCQNMQNPPNISQNTESVAQMETQNTENLKSVSQNNETTAQAKSQKEKETEEDSSQSANDCVFSGNNFCFSEWKDYPKVDLGDGVFLELAPTYVSLGIGDKYIDSIDFEDYKMGVMTTIWSYDFDQLICEKFYKNDENCYRDNKDWETEYPELFRESVKKSFQESLFFRIEDKHMSELTNAPKDIAIVLSSVYEWPAPLWVFDIKNKKLLSETSTNDLDYIYKTDDFIAIQEFPHFYDGDKATISFFFNNDSVIKIPDPNEVLDSLKSVKIDKNNTVHFIYHCGIKNIENINIDEWCKERGNEIKITKKLEELFGLSEK